jgi:hypothetical protein
VDRSVELVVEPGRFRLCRLDATAALPTWATAGELWSVLRSPGELSILVAESLVPPGVTASASLVGLRVAGVLVHTAVGILARLSDTLARAAVPILAVSSFDTDYLFVPASTADRARDALRAAGYALAWDGVCSNT